MQETYKFSRLLNFTFFSLFILAIIGRYSGLIINPRMYAEESIYYETFLNSNHWWEGFDALIQPAYYVLSLRLAAFAAIQFDPINAPMITTLAGLLVLSVPLTILFFTNCKYWESLQSKIVLTCFIVFSCSTGEIWLNSTGTGFIFPLAAFLILLDDNLRSQFKTLYYSLILILGILSGPITLLMSPFFLVKYLFTKDKKILLFCSIFLIFGLMQIFYFYISSNLGVSNINRGNYIDLEFFHRFYYWLSPNIIFPIFGYFISLTSRMVFIGMNSETEMLTLLNQLQSIFPSYIYEVINSILLGVLYLGAYINILLLAIVLLVIFREYRKSCKDENIYFISLFLYLSLITNLLSLSGHGGFRYSFVTGFILLFYLYQQLSRKNKKFNKTLARVFIVSSILIGILEYYPRVISYTPDTLFSEKVEWPTWNKELAKWDKNPSYKPKIWPYIKEKDLLWPERTATYSINMSHQEVWELEGNHSFYNEFRKKLPFKKRLINSP